MQARQVPVQDDDVVAAGQGPLQPSRAIERDVDGHLGLAQADGDSLGHLPVIFDHQHPHGRSFRRTPYPGCPAWGFGAVSEPGAYLAGRRAGSAGCWSPAPASPAAADTVPKPPAL